MRFLSHGSKDRPSLRGGFVPTEALCLRQGRVTEMRPASRAVGRAWAAGRAAGGLARPARGAVVLFPACSCLLR